MNELVDGSETVAVEDRLWVTSKAFHLRAPSLPPPPNLMPRGVLERNEDLGCFNTN